MRWAVFGEAAALKAFPFRDGVAHRVIAGIYRLLGSHGDRWARSCVAKSWGVPKVGSPLG
jgi:hypothetical protein